MAEMRHNTFCFYASSVLTYFVNIHIIPGMSRNLSLNSSGVTMVVKSKY